MGYIPCSLLIRETNGRVEFERQYQLRSFVGLQTGSCHGSMDAGCRGLYDWGEALWGEFTTVGLRWFCRGRRGVRA